MGRETLSNYDERLDWLTQRAQRAEAELSVLHATDDYQRWALAVVERDAAREQVGRVRALLDEAENRMEPPHWPRALREALDGGAAT